MFKSRFRVGRKRKRVTRSRNEGLSDEELSGLADVVEYAGWLWGKLLKLKLVHGLLGFSLLLQHLLADCLVALREL
uniref:Uncharacterized protein n=1 Tax=Cruciviridae sp. TaxID=1955495 RepID=A0A1S6LVL8_9VIRU|nr:hypothetical protein [Cruciviridae sp.]